MRIKKMITKHEISQYAFANSNSKKIIAALKNQRKIWGNSFSSEHRSFLKVLETFCQNEFILITFAKYRSAIRNQWRTLRRTCTLILALKGLTINVSLITLNTSPLGAPSTVESSATSRAMTSFTCCPTLRKTWATCSLPIPPTLTSPIWRMWSPLLRRPS